MERFPFETDVDVAPTIEVRVYRDGRLVHQELCESEDDAAGVVALWEGPGVTAEVDDLSAVARLLDDADRIDETAPPLIDDEYPRG